MKAFRHCWPMAVKDFQRACTTPTNFYEVSNRELHNYIISLKKIRGIWNQLVSYTVKKSVLKIQEYIHEGANLKFYIPESLNFKLLISEYSPIYRFWFQTATYFFYSVGISPMLKLCIALVESKKTYSVPVYKDYKGNMFHPRMGRGEGEFFFGLAIELIFYIEILLYITADIQSKRPRRDSSPTTYIIIVSWWQHHHQTKLHMARMFINPLTQSVRIRTVFNVSLHARIFVIFSANRFLFFFLERGCPWLSSIKIIVSYELLRQSYSWSCASIGFPTEYHKQIDSKQWINLKNSKFY
jgi:hypothetical protein